MNTQLLQIVNQILSLAVIMAQVGVVVGIFLYLFFKDKFTWLFNWMGKRGVFMVFLISTASMLGSLFYSDVALFEPCVLCWFQRIFMYPLAIILSVAVIKKSRDIVDYVLPLPIIGFLIALYHSYLYYTGNTACQIAGRGVSCTQKYVFEFGYVTIPLMSLTAFAVIILVLLLAREYRHDERS